MSRSLEHHVLKADLEGSAERLGIVLSEHESESISENLRMDTERIYEARLPRPSGIEARFSHENVGSWLKKLLAEEIEVGQSHFDDHVFVETPTKEATARLLAQARVQTALIMLVLPTRHVEVLGDIVRVVDQAAQGEGRDLKVELLALAALVAEAAAAAEASPEGAG